MKHEKRDCTGWVEPYTVQPLMLSVSVSRLRKGEERAGEREDGVELGEYGENHGLGEDVVAVGHLMADHRPTNPRARPAAHIASP